MSAGFGHSLTESKKGAKVVFTAEHVAIVKELMAKLSSPEVSVGFLVL